MKQSRTSKLAYAAGLLDGEGSISVSTQFRNAHLTVSLAQKDGRLIDWMFGTFGGNVYLGGVLPATSYAPGSRMYQWHMTASKAKDLLVQLLPFLKLKKRQAELAIQYQTRVEQRKGIYSNPVHPCRGMVLTDHERKLRTEIALQLRALKQDWRESVAVHRKYATNGPVSSLAPAETNRGDSSLAEEK